MTPPWHSWHRPLRIIHGHNGCLLAVQVRDVYQDIPADKFSEDWSAVSRVGRELADKRGAPYWLEAWLLRDGKWSESKPLAELLRSELRFLTRSFIDPTPDAGFFELQVVGETLWWSDGRDLHVLQEAGAEATWPLPGPEAALKDANLVLLSDNALWCVAGRDVTSVKLAEGRILAKPQPELAKPLSETSQFHVARDGRLWMFREDLQGSGGMSFVFRNGEWSRTEGLGLFVLEDHDGALWFLPGDGEGSHNGTYTILKGEKRFRLPMPRDFLKGKLAPAGKDRLLAACGDRVILLARCKEEPGWSVQRTLGLKRYYESGPIRLDEHGSLVGKSGWNARWPEP